MLMGASREGHPLGQAIEHLGRGLRGGPATELDRVPATHNVAGSELLPDLPGQGSDVERVELDEVGRRRRHGAELRSSSVARRRRSYRPSQRYTVERPTPKWRAVRLTFPPWARCQSSMARRARALRLSSTGGW
jgi:hypothetical protein